MKKILLYAVLLLSGFSFFAQEMRFGVRIEPEDFDAAGKIVAELKCDPNIPIMLDIKISAGWEEEQDFGALTAFLEKGAASGYSISLLVPVPKTEGEGKFLALAKLSETTKKHVKSFELILSKDDFSEDELKDAQKLGFNLKRLVTSLRGDSKALVYLGSLTDDLVPVLEPLFKEDMAVYLDGYATFDVDNSGDATYTVKDFVQDNHVGAPLRLHLPKVKNSLGAQSLTMLSLSAGSKEVDIMVGDLEEGVKGLIYLRKAIPETMLAGYVVGGVEIKEGGNYRSDVAVLPFLDSDEMIQGFFIAPNISNSAKGQLTLHLSTADISNPRSYPLPGGDPKALGYTADQKEGTCDLKINWEALPQFILLERLKTGTVGSGDMTVTGLYKVPVELVIARHQAVEQAQSALLRNYTANAKVDYHFKIPGTSGSLDITFINQFLYNKRDGARWIQKDLLANGVKWKGKAIPELPIIEPEKINTLPLVLTLSRNYSYRLVKEAVFEGRPCYIVEFLPLPGAEEQNVSGKVWIDKESYVKRQIQIIQKNMAAPQVSNEEFNHYTVVDSSERYYNMLTSIKAQQIFTVIGQTVTGEKEVSFTDMVVNDPEFESKLEQALKSDSPILQDTEKGYKYLEKQPDGTRTIRWEEKTGKLAAIGGAYYDKSLDCPIPFAGIDYFDYNFKKKNIQVNMFLAGPVDSVSISKADILPKVDASLSGVFFLISFKDKYFDQGFERKDEELKSISQHIFGSLGYRVTEFSKLKLTLEGEYTKFSDTDETSDAFEVPKSHFDFGYGLSWDYSRKGWQAAGTYAGHKRSSWENWGYGVMSNDIDKTKEYALWDLSLGKTFYLPNFQKLGSSLSYMDGKDLDRFSKYEFTYMGSKSLSGFTGSGIRFDKGAIARVLYAFDVANVIRFSANIDYAKVKPNRNDSCRQKHAGLGFSGNVAGPWSTFWSLDLGYALMSDIPEVEHDATVALVVMKLWGR